MVEDLEKQIEQLTSAIERLTKLVNRQTEAFKMVVTSINSFVLNEQLGDLDEEEELEDPSKWDRLDGTRLN